MTHARNEQLESMGMAVRDFLSDIKDLMLFVRSLVGQAAVLHVLEGGCAQSTSEKTDSHTAKST